MTADLRALLAKRHALTHHEQMLDAQQRCVPCKLCGGKALISDAGFGAGYYIRCENRPYIHIHKGCMIGDNRLGGWAYNVMDWWNCLHAQQPAATGGEVPSGREQALVDAVRLVLSHLGSPDGYFPDIGAPNTRTLQRAFAAYEPFPQSHSRNLR